MKSLLTVDELVVHMKEKGITFNEIAEEDAKIFLAKNNYYMKLASYRSNYSKCDAGKRIGKYSKLDFAYLKELSTIDMYLRYKIMNMCLDIEHAIKVKLLKKITNNPQEDGYNIVRLFLAEDTNFRILKSIKSHKSGGYCKDLIEKYYPYFPVWVFVEVISFGDLLYLCSFYEKIYGIRIVNNQLMNSIRDIRNASAHSNCLLNQMTTEIDETKQPNNEITTFIKNMNLISDSSRKNNLKYQFTYSFVTLLYVYDNLMQEEAKIKRYQELQEFMNTRVNRNPDYFRSNTKIMGVYNFLEKVVDNLVGNEYNIEHN